LPAVGDADDLFYDETLRRVSVIGGAGGISVFQQKDADHYEHIAEIQTSLGARTGFFAGGSGALSGGRYGSSPLYFAVREGTNHGAALWIFGTRE